VILFHELARQELHEAVRWYHQRSATAAEQFVVQLERAIERLAIDPESHTLISREHYCIRVARFPYILVFQVKTNGDVLIVAIANTSRRPGNWSRRK
jgi:plasmid stabilization system protein ParE